MRDKQERVSVKKGNLGDATIGNTKQPQLTLSKVRCVAVIGKAHFSCCPPPHLPDVHDHELPLCHARGAAAAGETSGAAAWRGALHGHVRVAERGVVAFGEDLVG